LQYEGNMHNHKSLSLFHQMTHICREKGALRFDDQLDALTMMVQAHIDVMNQDTAKVFP
jgi:hypothetical protein